MRKAKVELTAEVVRKAIEDGKPASMTQLAHHLGYKGSVSSTLTKKLRQLIPDIDARLAANKPAKKASQTAIPAAEGKDSPPAKPIKQANLAKPAQSTQPAPSAKGPAKQAKSPKLVGARGGKYPHDPRNPSVLAAYTE